MARLLWPGDYEWIYLTVELLKRECLPGRDLTIRRLPSGSDQTSEEARIASRG